MLPTSAAGFVPAAAPPAVIAVNVGRASELFGRRRPRRTAIVKHAMPGPVRVRVDGLDGDEQVNRAVHGGNDKAVHAYAIEDVGFFVAQLGRPLDSAAFGENLTLRGMDLGAAVIGERWAVGTTILEVSQPRYPCATLGVRLNDPSFVRRFARAGRPGVYLRVLRDGVIRAGDLVDVITRPVHGVTARLVFDAALDHTLAAQALAAEQLPADLRAWLERRAAN
jgi:MOSC domain-containing protein YiiM